MKIIHASDSGPKLGESGWRGFYDPFSEELKWVTSYKATDYFTSNYNLELWQVWALVNGFDKDYYPLCPICNSGLDFRGVVLGYRTTCSNSCALELARLSSQTDEAKSKRLEAISKSWTDGRRAHQSELASNQMTEQWKDPEWRDHMKDKGFNNPLMQAEAKRTQFINNGNASDECILYLAKHNSGKYKFGVTSIDINDKMRISNYVELTPMQYSNRICIADLEYNLAMHFKGEWLDENQLSEFHEVFNKLNK